MGKNLWEIAVDCSKQTEKERKEPKDSVILLAGSKNGGKTSLCYKFLERIEVPKSTLALEYLFGRRSKGIEAGKEICHIWELGGGTVFLDLIEIPVTPDSLGSLSVILVLDLSKLEELWYTMETLMFRIKKQISSSSHLINDPSRRNSLANQAKSRTPEDHEDANLIEPFPVPLLIIGSKYDIFQNFDYEKKKVLCKCLRYVAHLNSASLQFVSNKSETLITKVRASISSLAFGTSCSKTAVLDHNKALYINAGADSFQSIGLLSADNQTSPKSLAVVKEMYASSFPASENKKLVTEDPAADPHFKEPDVDVIRAQKAQELMKYKERAGKTDSQWNMKEKM